MARSYGDAGKSLGSNEANSKFGRENASIGLRGEKYFRDVLERAGVDRDYDIWYSLKIPSDPHNRNATKYSSDVDVALTSGNKLLLIDVKMWSASSAYWSLFGLPFKGLSPMIDKKKGWRLSSNMAAAVDRYQKNLPGVSVQAMVIFVPTRAGGAAPMVNFLKWPGDIRSYSSQDGLRKAKKWLGRGEETTPKLRALMGRMVR
jgi:hypothetical protein